MIKQINTPQFQTSDNTIFAKESDALLHQAGLDNDVAINDYLVGADTPERTRVTLRKHILGFLASQPAPKDEANAPEAVLLAPAPAVATISDVAKTVAAGTTTKKVA